MIKHGKSPKFEFLDSNVSKPLHRKFDIELHDVDLDKYTSLQLTKVLKKKSQE